MEIDASIFKAYDIRGIYPEQINAEVVYAIAQGYTKLFNPKSVAVGHDMRLSGREFKEALSKGFRDAGVNVVDLGLIPSDALYFAVPFLNLDGGITATASHNPKEFGGLKMVKQQAGPISGDSGIYQIRDLVAGGIKLKSETLGTLESRDILEDYFKLIFSKFDLQKIKPFKIVANANYGMANLALEKFKQVLPVEFVKIINNHLDGSFPKGRPDPLRPENRAETTAVIEELKPNLGVAWDGDGDRCFFYDEQGRFVTPAYISALIAKYYLQKNPGAKILHDTRVVRVIDAAILGNGGVVVKNKAGYTFIKERMIKDDVVFGCETSAHYFFKDYGYHDNGLIPFLVVLEILSSSEESFSEILRPLREKFFISDEINFEFNNPNILEDIKNKYTNGDIDDTDGYSFNYPAWRFNARKSNTENLLRINVEADGAELLKQKIDEVSGLINAIK